MDLRHDCILQVEDDENDVFLLKHAFKRAGIAAPPTVVNDGTEALAYLRGEGRFSDRTKYPVPQLVLLDLKLPCLSGFEVLQWIRSQPVLATMVVIIFSSSPDPGDIQRAYRLGANSFVVKPADVKGCEDFALLVKRWWLEFNQFAQSSEANNVLPAPMRSQEAGRT
jgi:CheY-like chemotaxis protein